MNLSSPCIPWTGHITSDGYGYIHGKGGGSAHRHAYLTQVGPIPKGMHVDHVCHNVDPSCPGGAPCPHRRCVNVEHLEVVTEAENILRGKSFSGVNARKTHCPKGHPYDEANTYRWQGPAHAMRNCRECTRIRQREYAAKVGHW